MISKQTAMIREQAATIGEQETMRFLGGLDPCQSLSDVAQDLFMPIEARAEGAKVRLD